MLRHRQTDGRTVEMSNLTICHAVFRRAGRAERHQYHYGHDVELVQPSGECDQTTNQAPHVCKIHQLPPPANGEYGYTHVWEVRNTQASIMYRYYIGLTVL